MGWCLWGGGMWVGGCRHVRGLQRASVAGRESRGACGTAWKDRVGSELEMGSGQVGCGDIRGMSSFTWTTTSCPWRPDEASDSSLLHSQDGPGGGWILWSPLPRHWWVEGGYGWILIRGSVNFPLAALTHDHHKHGDLKQHSFFLT